MRRTVLAVTTAAALCLGTATTAPAVVPPKNCGTIKVKGKRYNVKADQLSCRSAKTWTRRYLERRRKPKGYKCNRYKNTKLVFRCHRGIKNYFAIKR